MDQKNASGLRPRTARAMLDGAFFVPRHWASRWNAACLGKEDRFESYAAR